MFCNRKFWSVAFLFVLASCADRAPVFIGNISADTQKIPAPIFLNATSVKAYVGNNLRVSDDGTVTSGNTLPPEPPTPQPVPAEDTAMLTKAEILSLQNSVYFTQQPEVVKNCVCDYGHAFTFYDANGHYIGYFAVCFRCGCTDLSSVPANTTGLPVLNWDGSILKKIFIAHHLSI